MKRKFVTLGIAVALSVATCMSAFAGEWQKNETGWWWQNDDGSYPINQWQEINGKQYYFDENGYMLSNTTTPDGYKVGSDGSWIQEQMANTSSSEYPDNILFHHMSGGTGYSYNIMMSETTLFYSRDNTLFASNRDGSNERPLHTFEYLEGMEIYLIGDMLYALNLHSGNLITRMKTDGSQFQVLYNQNYSESFVRGSHIYITQSTGDPFTLIDYTVNYYQMDLDGNNLVIITKEEYQKKKDIKDFVSNTPEFRYMRTKGGGYQIFRDNGDGTKTDLFRIPDPSSKDISYAGVIYFNSNSAFYFEIKSLPSSNMWVHNSKWTLCTVNLHTKEQSRVETDTDIFAPIYASDNYIYYLNSSDSYSLYRMDLNGNGSTKVWQGNGGYTEIAGGFEDFVYLTNATIVNGGI